MTTNEAQLSVDSYISQDFPISCKGRDDRGKDVLSGPVLVTLRIYKHSGSDSIEGSVECPYNTGSHGQRCKASHPDVDKVGDGIICPYSFDIPYALENKNRFD